MTAATVPQPAIPAWLVDATIGLVTSAYQAGLADRPAVQASAPTDSTVLDRLEAAALLRCSRTKLDELVRHGVVPSFKLGNRRLFNRADLEQFLAAQPMPSAAALPPRGGAAPQPSSG